MGEYGTSATDVKAEYIWMEPEAANDNVWGGVDGIGGYAPLAVASAPSAAQRQSTGCTPATLQGKHKLGSINV